MIQMTRNITVKTGSHKIYNNSKMGKQTLKNCLTLKYEKNNEIENMTNIQNVRVCH